MKIFALVGNPNSGKSTLFNNLTGGNAYVGNWPGVTVDKKEGTYKKTPEPVRILDLPGIYSLSPYTPEEVIARNVILGSQATNANGDLEEKPNAIINIVDATNLERNLYLTTQLLEMDIPVIIALNMMDLVEKNGHKIDAKAISEKLGIPVVPISAQKSEGIDELMDVAYETANTTREGKTVLADGALGHLINDVKIAFKGMDVAHPLFHAVKLVENDELEVEDHKELVKIVSEFKKTFKDDTFGDDLEAVAADARYQFISKNLSGAKTLNDNLSEEEANAALESRTKSDKIDKVLTHKWFGIPIFLVLLFLIFHLTFSENLFYLGGILQANGVSPSFAGSPFEGLFWSDAGIMSPGVILQTFMISLTDNVLSPLFAGWLSGAPSWLSGFLVDGVWAGIAAVLSFVPQILLLFLFFSLLEDSGYMARVAFMLDRIFRRFGVSGKAILPMIMGFGCSIPAMINTRTLPEENERVATIRVIPFFSCGAKQPILIAIAGAIVSNFGFPNVDLIVYLMYLAGIIVAFAALIIMRATTMRGKPAPFIMELPQYHRPQAKALGIHLWDKLKHYMKKAFTIILAAIVAIWFLQSFTFDWKFIPDQEVNVVDLTEEVYTDLAENDSTYSLLLEEAEYKNEDELTPFADIYNEYVEVQATVEELSNKESLTQEEKDELEEAKASALEFDLIVNPVLVASFDAFKETVSDPEYLDVSDSILAGFGKIIQPIFTPLGFGYNIGVDKNTSWVYSVSAFTGLIAKENVPATFAQLAASVNKSNISLQASDDAVTYEDLYVAQLNAEDGTDATKLMIKNTGVSWAALIAFIIFNMTTIPCFAAVATASGEMNKKRFKYTILFWLGCSYICGTIFYLSLRYWWPIAIFAAMAVGFGFFIHYFNKSRDDKNGQSAN